MQKISAFIGLLSIGLVLGTSSGTANTITLSGTGNTTAQTITGSTGSLTLNALGSLTVSGGTAAVTLNGSNPSTISVTNNGTINQTGTAQALVDAGGHMTITINNGSSSNSAATLETTNGDTIHLDHATNNVTLNNFGSITSFNTSLGGNQAVDWNGITDGGIASQGSNTLNNFSTGVITATEADAVRPGVNGFVNNSGTIKSTTTTGSSSDGIDLQTNTGVTITNAASSTAGAGATNLIEGGRHGITGGNTGTLNGVVQTGTQLGGYTGTGAYALTVVNNAGGTIQGDDGSGINIDGFGIQGPGSTLITNELVSVTNHGTITGDGLSRDGDGIDVDGDVVIDNFGSIISKNAVPEAGSPAGTIEFSEGVTVGGGTITNETGATIEGQVASGNTQAVGRGITLAGIDHDVNDNDFPIQSIYENSTITNSGTIKGDSESGITVLGTTGGGYTVTITNNSTGTIEGKNTGVSENGVIPVSVPANPYSGQLSGQSLNQAAIELDDTGNTYVINNSGTIQQDDTTDGTAVAMHGVSNTLNITGGSASVIGDVSGDTAADSTLNITPGTGNSFSYGYKISNFTVNINSDGTNGTVTFSGANTYSGPTTISGGTAYINNTSGSGSGTGPMEVKNGATLGGTGSIQTSGTNAVTVDAGGTLAAGGIQPTVPAINNIAQGSLKLDTTNFTPGNGANPNAILNLNSANLTFALGSGNATSGSQIIVTGGVANTIAFSGSNTVAINDLTSGNLTFNQEYVLIDGNNTTYTGLQLGATTAFGTQIIGGLSLLPANTNGNGFSQVYSSSQLYLSGDNIEVVATPEPKSVLLGLIAMMMGIFLQARYRRDESKS